MKESDFNKVFSRRLKYYLDQNRMTQLELSKRLNVGTTSVSNWCNGIKSPRMDKVDAMCALFGCRRSDLMEDPAVLPDPAPSLRQDETDLLQKYNQLNETGRDKVQDYTTDLLDNPRYLEDVGESLALDVG